ncbi:MAG: hypothetical protein HUU14_08630 [Dehalococcoidia bacterium]|nr:MAG: hypothetical protein EDM76_10025 [bacterium]MCE7927651.1 hypothetical protein [Chloroflexi bacterium CFX7]MCK6565545.1 hypothetical protein [Dehalococcoidia bacterium]MCL4230510.1 hypothetical protein [Dehalococcoidia bacterium]NUQ55933.1 hypothetical protein [Dehalococcoidia bacterium]
MQTALLNDLMAQHRAYLRRGYDGHNRRPIQTTLAMLRRRRTRRRWAYFLRQQATWWEAA